jgi:hypothetical protein
LKTFGQFFYAGERLWGIQSWCLGLRSDDVPPRRRKNPRHRTIFEVIKMEERKIIKYTTEEEKMAEDEPFYACHI